GRSVFDQLDHVLQGGFTRPVVESDRRSIVTEQSASKTGNQVHPGLSDVVREEVQWSLDVPSLSFAQHVTEILERGGNLGDAALLHKPAVTDDHAAIHLVREGVQLVLIGAHVQQFLVDVEPVNYVVRQGGEYALFGEWRDPAHAGHEDVG